MQTFFALYTRLVTWIRAGSNWRWIVGGLAVVVLFILAPLFLFKRSQSVPSADLDLQHLKHEAEIEKEAVQEKAQNEKTYQEQVQKIDKDTHTASPEQLRKDTLREVLND